MARCVSSSLTLTCFALIVIVHGAANTRLKQFKQRSRKQRRLSDDWIQSHSHHISNAIIEPCPCANPQWCHPITSSPSIPFRESGEVYGFAASHSTGERYNWTHISTVAWVTDDLMCRAHQHGVRAVEAAPFFNLTQITSYSNKKDAETHIREWVDATLSMVRARSRDGIVFDFEGPMSLDSSEGKAYVTLIQATRDAFHNNNPSLQVTTCVAWSPDGIDGRNFPHVELANASDFLYVMDYDTQSQIIQGPCIANANAPFTGMQFGISRFLELGISPKKLILGVPWYGYRYECLEGTKSNDRYCPIRQVPFRGVNCSDAAGSEVPYSKIMQIYRNMTNEERNTTGGMKRDEYTDARYFNSIKTGKGSAKSTVIQYWFDDPHYLRDKFAWAKCQGLGGIGPYTYDDLDPVEGPGESQAVWSTFDVYRSDVNHHLYGEVFASK